MRGTWPHCLVVWTWVTAKPSFLWLLVASCDPEGTHLSPSPASGRGGSRSMKCATTCFVWSERPTGGPKAVTGTVSPKASSTPTATDPSLSHTKRSMWPRPIPPGDAPGWRGWRPACGCTVRGAVDRPRPASGTVAWGTFADVPLWDQFRRKALRGWGFSVTRCRQTPSSHSDATLSAAPRDQTGGRPPPAAQQGQSPRA